MRCLFWVIIVCKSLFFWRENRLDKTMLYNIFPFRILTLFVLFARSFLHFSSFILAIFYHFGQFHGMFTASLLHCFECLWVGAIGIRHATGVDKGLQLHSAEIGCGFQLCAKNLFQQSFLRCKIRQERLW